MKNKGTQNEEIRCINKKTGKVKYFRRWYAESKNWQKNTGFMPEELPKIKLVSGETDPAYSIDKVVAVAYESSAPGNEPEFDESLITTPSESYSEHPKLEVVNADPIKETPTTPTAKPKGKKADKTTHK